MVLMTDMPPPPPPSTSTQNMTTKSATRVGEILRYAFLTVVVIEIFEILAFARRLSFIHNLFDNPTNFSEAEAIRLDRNVENMASLSLIGSIAVFILLILWLYRLTVSSRTQGATFSRSNGWAIGGFFIPFANFFIPYKFIKENILFQISRETTTSQTLMHLKLWWFLFVGTTILTQASSSIPRVTLDQLRASDILNIIAATAFLLCAYFGAKTVKEMSQTQNSAL